MEKVQEKEAQEKAKRKEGVRRVIVKACDELDGELKGNVCMVEGYPLGPSENILKYKPEKQKLETWKPQKFLDLTGWERGEEWPTFSEEKAKELKKHIKEEKPLDIPFIDKDEEMGFETVDGIVPNHEGRHRAYACKLSKKCDKIPVSIFKM